MGLKIGQWVMVNFPWAMSKGLHWNSPSEALIEDRVGLKIFSASQWMMIRFLQEVSGGRWSGDIHWSGPSEILRVEERREVGGVEIFNASKWVMIIGSGQF